jgi:glycerophosphoryl diester phosphodiesterase
MAADVKRLVLDSGSARRVIVSAFDFDDNDVGSNSSWDDLSLLCPEVPIALLATARKVSRIGVNAFIGQATRYGAAAIHPHRTAPIRDLTAAAHAASLRVHVWTVNQASEGSLFREFGVDAIFTDFPEKFRDI